MNIKWDVSLRAKRGNLLMIVVELSAKDGANQ
jgi:hypothetical protein